MKLYLVRHGEPSYTPCTQRGLIGQGRDLSALNEDGIEQIEKCSLLLKNCDAQVILSSPYTRALQSAAIIAKHTGLTTKVVHDLHEWIPDLTFQYKTYHELKMLYQEFELHRGKYPQDERLFSEYTRWEPLEDLRTRVKNCLIPYCDEYDSAIIVAHGMVIQTLHYQYRVEYGEIIEIEFSRDSIQPDWIFKDKE